MDTPLPEKFAYSVADASLASGVGRSQIYEAVAAGELVARKRGTSTLILADDLKAWLAALPTWKPSHGRVEAAARARDGQVAKRLAKAQEALEEAERRTSAKARRRNVETRSAAR
jgi:excisionase family DNA binding protein